MDNLPVLMAQMNGASLIGIELLNIHKGRLDDRIGLLSVTRNKEHVYSLTFLEGT
jgi:hypothetical protein